MSSMWKCPGQDTIFWRAGDIFEEPCPHCGNPIEFWKDDIKVKCPNCGQIVTNPKFNPGCAAWCSYASNCLGEEALIIQHEPQVVRDRLKIELSKELKGDRALLNRALKAASMAERIVKEEGADMIITVAASLFHVLSATASGGEGPRPGAAERIMERVDLAANVQDEIRSVLASLKEPSNPAENRNLQVTVDAITLAELYEKRRHISDPAEARIILEDKLFTAAGRKLALEAVIAQPVPKA